MMEIQIDTGTSLRNPAIGIPTTRFRASVSNPRRNRLLASLPQREFEQIAPFLEMVSLDSGASVHSTRNGVQQLYFPADCIISVLHLISDGRSIEVAVIGSEGLVGASVVMGGYDSFSHAVVQSTGWAYRLNGAIFKKSLNRCEETLAIVLRYTHSLYLQTAQTAVCSRHHSILQQLVRRLLLGMDRSASTTLVMTHESMAAKLGVRRESVTEAAGKLQSLGLINYRRGRIKIVDRPRLESLCCECYECERQQAARFAPI
jgi:CRP-like cAMP-binding protein